MDVVITNSKNVQERLRQYVGIEDAVVIHPPVEVNRYEWLGQENYFLSTARLEPYKRVDMIVQAFMQMPDRKLVVASGGSELSRLRKVAEDHANIRFTGWCSDRELRELLGRCTASIYLPMDEDFGISPIESMAAGKPVITVNEGGTRETVVHGETGLLLSPSVLDNPGSACAAISTAVEQISSQWADMRTACEHRATLYDVSVFDGKIRNLVHET